jgi:hypothetical protein
MRAFLPPRRPMSLNLELLLSLRELMKLANPTNLRLKSGPLINGRALKIQANLLGRQELSKTA